MADLRKSIEIVFEGNDQASRKAADVLARIKEMEAQTAAASTQGDKLAKSLDDVGGKAQGVSLLNDALKGLAVSLVFKAFVDANVEVEKFEKGIQAVKGASADTAKELAFIREAANKYGVEVGALARSYTSLTAATIGTNLEGTKTRDIFEAVVKAMAATGRSSAETEGALRAIEQIAGKGKVQMEELRGQLGDRLPGALQIAARALGTTTGQPEEIVKKGLDANDFLPKFAEELNKTFAGAKFDGYEANLARLRSKIDELLVTAGKAGAFDLLTGAVEQSTKGIQRAQDQFSLLSTVYDVVALKLKSSVFGELADDAERLGVKLEFSRSAFSKGADEFISESQRLAEKAGGAFKALGSDISSAFAGGPDQFAAETERLQRLNNTIKASADTYKVLGIDAANASETLRSKVITAFEELAKASQTTSKEISVALGTALKNATTIDDINRIGQALTEAYTSGKLSSADFAKETEKLGEAQRKILEPTNKQAEAIKKQAEETKRAQEKAEAFRLEMEKLASNERIKLIEAKVTLDVANLQEQTKRVQALFGSIDNTINSTGDLLKSLFSQLSNFGTLDPGTRDLIRDQIESENRRRDAALEIQKKISEAQIDYLRAQTKALDRGDALIKVDGAGLQPHLEAFMWEILRSIQVRVNQDGLKLLLGV